MRTPELPEAGLELRKMADRIQARAIKRCGDLLREIESQSKANLKQYRDSAKATSVTRAQAADGVGLSRDKAIRAIRIANVPDEEFREAIESDVPESKTALAERGKQSRQKPIVDIGDRDPEEQKIADSLIAAFSEFINEQIRPALLARQAEIVRLLLELSNLRWGIK